MNVDRPSRDPYLVKCVLHCAKLLSAFQSPGEVLPLRTVTERSGLPKSMAFRLLYTLERCGMMEKVGENRYRSHVPPFKSRSYRFGYAAQGTDYQFSQDISASLQRASSEQGIELICLDNQYSPKVAKHNADVLVREKVDLVVEYQTDETVASIVADKYRQAGIPFIAVEIPHPGATYFGANNYEAGLMAGRYLARWARQHCKGVVDEILLLDLARAGALPHMRLTGLLVGLRSILPNLTACPVKYLDGDGELGTSFEVTRRYLRSTRARFVLVGAVNDLSALGALRAFIECGRTEDCAVVGQNASPEGRAEMRKPDTRLVGSVGYFPEKYGVGIVSLALDIVNRSTVPAAVFVKHQMVTPETVDHYYANDVLLKDGLVDV